MSVFVQFSIIHFVFHYLSRTVVICLKFFLIEFSLWLGIHIFSYISALQMFQYLSLVMAQIFVCYSLLHSSPPSFFVDNLFMLFWILSSPLAPWWSVVPRTEASHFIGFSDQFHGGNSSDKDLACSSDCLLCSLWGETFYLWYFLQISDTSCSVLKSFFSVSYVSFFIYLFLWTQNKVLRRMYGAVRDPIDHTKEDKK